MKLLLSILLPFIAGLSGQFIIGDWLPWYETLQRPFFAPPNWIFGPVWTLLYLFMGIAFYLIWKNHSKNKNRAIIYYFIQLILNALWTPLFFGLQQTGLALAEIILLNFAIGLTIKEFYKIDKRAGYLLMPYLAWTLFAMLLNAGFWWQN